MFLVKVKYLWAIAPYYSAETQPQMAHPIPALRMALENDKDRFMETFYLTKKMSLKGKVAIVTGASRGIGKGIALQLGEAGATVYITGRKPENYDDGTKLFKFSTLEETAQEITKRGGKGIAKYVDHSDAKSVKEFFDQVEKEQNGKLDILVNNAYAAVPYIFGNVTKKFYELEPEYTWDIINNVGLRNNYIAATYATRIFLKQKSGFIVFISSVGGKSFLFNTAYGVGKAANDRLAADLGAELRGTGISVVSLWPGAVKTEIVEQAVLKNEKGVDETSKKLFNQGESIEFPGKAIVALANDPELTKFSGKIFNTATLAKKYNLHDLDGSQPLAYPGHQEYIDFINKTRVDDASVELPKV
uniref:Dehydrogenase/reductase SDR family member 1 n=1 Tax=Panagrolaimus sp. JU765 TaxID=591449 RepID=A0AC34RI57_9BILA